MTAIVGVYSRRRCEGQCDARCYGAMQPSKLKEPRRSACICICGGANHGMGLNRAICNTLDRGIGLSPKALEVFAKLKGLEGERLVVIDRLRVHTEYRAREMAKLMLAPAPVTGKDLFACEEVT